MCAQQFNSGDVVQLKSGGPKMTVDEVSDDTVVTKWFEKGNIKYAEFKAIELKEE